MNSRARTSNKAIKLIAKHRYRYFYSVERKAWIWRQEACDKFEKKEK